jgi:hypothetical protein
LDFDLQKKEKLVTDLLAKKGVTKAPVMRVGAALDISYSMRPHINDGKPGNRLQKTVDQLMGPALKFDDNGEIDMFKFDDQCEYVGTCSPKTYSNYVEKNGIRIRGGTAYTPIVEAAQKFFFGSTKQVVVEPAKKGLFGFGGKPAVTATARAEKADNSPVLMMVITDGEVGVRDRDDCERALRAAISTNIYYHFVGVGKGNNNRGGPTGFPTIHYLADALPNVGEVYLPDFGMSDEEVYEQLICDELIEFIGKFSNNSVASAG